MRPVQAEPAERKHRRRRCRSQGGASRTSLACAPTTRHPRRRKTDGQRPCRQRAHSKRACTQGQPGHRVPTAILFRMGPPCKYGSAEQPHYKLYFISGSGHRTQGGARHSEGGVCAIIESRRCAAARNILAFRWRLCRLEPKTDRSEEALSKIYICGRTGLGRDKTG